MLHRFRDPIGENDGHAPRQLRDALSALRRSRVELLSLRSLVERVQQRVPLERPAAVFTVDDGYLDFKRVAAPVFAEFDCPVTVFVVSDGASGLLWNWWDQVEHTVLTSERSGLTLELPTQSLRIELGARDDRFRKAAQIAELLKVLPDAARRPVLEAFATEAGVDLPATAPARYEMMGWEDLRSLESRGVEFGPHSQTHVVLSRECTARVRDEVVRSWRTLQRECRNPVPVFCYPNGTADSFTERDMQIVREAGLIGATSFLPGHVDPRTFPADDLYRLPRRTVPARICRTPLAVGGVFGIHRRVKRVALISPPPEAVAASTDDATAIPEPTHTAGPPVATGVVEPSRRTPRPSPIRAAVIRDGGGLGALGRNTALYTAAVVLSRAISVLMLPVYTRYLTPFDYGILQMLAMTSDIASILLTAGMTSGVQRFYFKATSERERLGVISTAFVLEVGLALIGTVLLLACAPLIWRHVLGGAGSVALVQIIAVDFSLGMLTAVPFMYLQTQQRTGAYVAITLARLTVQVLLNLYFLVELRLGVAGMVTSTLIANGLSGTLLAIWLIRQTGFRVVRSALHDLRRFGVPNQITFAGAFIITFGDRFFLQRSVGLATVGVYALAYQFGFLLVQVASGPFMQAWNPARFRLVGAPRADRDRAFSQAFFLCNVFLLTVAVGLAVFIQPLLALLTSASFSDAPYFVPIILAAYVAQSWMEIEKFGIDVSEKTRYHAYATWVSVVTTLILYASLIPAFGAHGAAWATLLGFLVRLLLTRYFAQRLWPVTYGWARVCKLSVVAAIAIGLYFVLAPTGVLRQLGVATLCSAMFVGSTWAFFTTRADRALILQAVKAPKAALSLLTSSHNP